MTKKRNFPESGRSMVEILGVLAIMGVLSIGGIYGYRYAMYLIKENQTLDTINKTVAGAIMGYLEQDTGKSTEGREEAEWLSPEKVISGVPVDSEGYINTPLNTDLSVYLASSPTGAVIEVQLDNITCNVCRRILKSNIGYTSAYLADKRHVGITQEATDSEIEEFCEAQVDTFKRGPLVLTPDINENANMILCYAKRDEDCELGEQTDKGCGTWMGKEYKHGDRISTCGICQNGSIVMDISSEINACQECIYPLNNAGYKPGKSETNVCGDECCGDEGCNSAGTGCKVECEDTPNACQYCDDADGTVKYTDEDLTTPCGEECCGSEGCNSAGTGCKVECEDTPNACQYCDDADGTVKYTNEDLTVVCGDSPAMCCTVAAPVCCDNESNCSATYLNKCVECKTNEDCADRTDGKTVCDSTYHKCKIKPECGSDSISFITVCKNKYEKNGYCQWGSCERNGCFDNDDCSSGQYCSYDAYYSTYNTKNVVTATGIQLGQKGGSRGLCTALGNSIVGERTGYLKSASSMNNWWSARNWCRAFGKELLDISGNRLSCGTWRLSASAPIIPCYTSGTNTLSTPMQNIISDFGASDELWLNTDSPYGGTDGADGVYYIDPREDASLSYYYRHNYGVHALCE